MSSGMEAVNISTIEAKFQRQRGDADTNKVRSQPPTLWHSNRPQLRQIRPLALIACTSVSDCMAEQDAAAVLTCRQGPRVSEFGLLPMMLISLWTVA